MRRVGIILAVALAICAAFPAHGHSWYPRECCSDHDCAPVENIDRFVAEDRSARQFIVTRTHGKAVIRQNIPVRESQDGRMHACMRYDPFGELEVICLFAPPAM